MKGVSSPALPLHLPQPLEDFEVRLLPTSIFCTVFILCTMTLVLQAFRIVCTYYVYRISISSKAFWRDMIEQVEQRQQEEPSSTICTDDDHHIAQRTPQQFEASLRMANRFEYLIDRFTDCFHRLIRGTKFDTIDRATMMKKKSDRKKSSSNSRSGSRSLNRRCGDNSATASTLSASTFQTENATTGTISVACDATRAEADRRAVAYLQRRHLNNEHAATNCNEANDPFNRRTCVKPTHECRWCSAWHDIRRDSHLRSVAFQIGHLLNTATAFGALLGAHLQTWFYAIGTIYVMTCVPFIISESVGKLQLFAAIISSQSSDDGDDAADLCGYQKVCKLTEAIAMLFSLAHFIAFMLTLILYMLRDEFFSQLLVDVAINSV